MTPETIQLICKTICGIFLLTGTAYLVEWRHWSPWWFLLAVLLIPGWRP